MRLIRDGIEVPVSNEDTALEYACQWCNNPTPATVLLEDYDRSGGLAAEAALCERHYAVWLEQEIRAEKQISEYEERERDSYITEEDPWWV